MLNAHTTVHGLVYIDNETAEAFWSRSSLAAAAGVQTNYVSRACKRGYIKEQKTVEILTAGGLQRGYIFPANEPGVLEFIGKHNPTLLSKIAGAGAKVYLHTLAGFVVSSSAAPGVPLTTARMFAATEHEKFQRTCVKLGYAANHVHDYMTKQMHGLTAAEARELPLVAGDESIGLNHISEAA